jgi:glycopeptide antibiotics resistance protein
VLQLIGNLCLLAVPAGLAVARWPAAGRTAQLAALAIGTATAIELLQWLLPLGRVVSPLDAALNAVGAVAAGLLVRSSRRAAPAGAVSRE